MCMSHENHPTCAWIWFCLHKELKILSNVDKIQVAAKAENVDTVAGTARIEDDSVGLGLGMRIGRIRGGTGSAEEPKLSGIQGVVKVTGFWWVQRMSRRVEHEGCLAWDLDFWWRMNFMGRLWKNTRESCVWTTCTWEDRNWMSGEWMEWVMEEMGL